TLMPVASSPSDRTWPAVAGRLATACGRADFLLRLRKMPRGSAPRGRAFVGCFRPEAGIIACPRAASGKLDRLVPGIGDGGGGIYEAGPRRRYRRAVEAGFHARQVAPRIR